MSIENKIVIVDDDSIVTQALKMLLTLEGFTNLHFFNSPFEALEFLKDEKNKPDLLISDFLMPKMNGIEFLSEAKKIYEDLTMILLTGYADKENAIKAINEVGIYRYLEKPWDNDDLIINIKNGIERSDLMSKLKEKVIQLEAAKKQLEKYSHSLEEMVAQRTQELVESNNKLFAIINYCADGIIILSPEGFVESVNPAGENLFGAVQEMLCGESIFNIFVPEKGRLDKSVLAGEREHLLRDFYIENKASGKKIPVEISVSPIYDEAENILRFVSVIRDESIQKDMDRLRDDFIATLTHDLRTPLLATIQTLSFFIDGVLGPLEEKQKFFLSTMKKSNEDILGLVNALLEVYKYESGTLNLCRTKFLLNDFLSQCKSEIENLAEKKEVNISLSLEQTNDLPIFADKNEIKRVIFNLLGNAINHNPKGTNVVLSSDRQKNDLIISVKDDGAGIPKSDIPKMFKRFSQGTSEKRSVGTGLGLYLSRQIVEAHGGKIWLETDKNKGTEFLFLLPEAVCEKENLATSLSDKV